MYDTLLYMNTTQGRTTQRTMRIRERTFKRIKKIASAHRAMPLVEVLDVLLDGWDQLTTDQQAQIVATPKKAGT